MSVVVKPNRPVYNKENLAETFKSSPFYLISTHGGYDIDRPDWYFNVPENTFIFETQFITDYCLTTIDEPLFNLLQGVNRGAFNYYFLDETAANRPYKQNLETVGGANFDANTYRKVISHLIMYGPGDRIPIREISIGRVGVASRRVYEGMVLNRFEPGQRAVKYPGTKETLIFHQRGQLHEQLVVDKESTNKEMIEEVLNMPLEKNRDPKQARVFFFSSCANLITRPKNNDQKKRLASLEEIQRNQILKLLSSGIYSVRGGPGGSTISTPVDPRNIASRKVKTTEVFLPEKLYGEHEMMAVDPYLRQNNLIVNTINKNIPKGKTRATKVRYLFQKIPANKNKLEAWKPILSEDGSKELYINDVARVKETLGTKNIYEYIPELKTMKPLVGGKTRKRHYKKSAKTLKYRR
jgi:hypothetical protein